ALHVVVCALAALHGLARLASRRARHRAFGASAAPSARTSGRFGPPQEIAIDVGLLLLPVGALWLLATRAAIAPLGFQEPIVMFTAAHFHFAGFAAPLILGCVGRFLYGTDRPPRAYVVAVIAVCAGVPLTAIGI